MIVVVTCVITHGQTFQKLQPVLVDKLTDISAQFVGQQVVDMSSGYGQLWVAVRTLNSKSPSLVPVPLDRATKPVVIALDGASTLNGMTPTAAGPAVVPVSGRTAAIHFYSD